MPELVRRPESPEPVHTPALQARQQSSRKDKLKSEARPHDTITVRNIPASMWYCR